MNKKLKNWRVNTVLVLVLIFGAAIISRLFFLQVLNHKLYQAQALGQQSGFNDITGSRGQIFCENSQSTKGQKGSSEVKTLAINRDEWILSADLKKVDNKSTLAEKISNYISLSKEEILSELDNSHDSYVVIKKDLSADETEKVKALNLKGVSLEGTSQRYYPQGELASQVLGFLGGEGDGQYGLEGYYNDILKGKTGIKEEKKGLNSFSDDSQVSLDGSDLYLTLDYNIQFQAESLLKKVIPAKSKFVLYPSWLTIR